MVPTDVKLKNGDVLLCASSWYVMNDCKQDLQTARTLPFPSQECHVDLSLRPPPQVADPAGSAP